MKLRPVRASIATMELMIPVFALDLRRNDEKSVWNIVSIE
jgi:hypothetical protein